MALLGSRHRHATVLLYRSILRGATRLKKTSLPEFTSNGEIQHELQKMKIDPKLYLQYLSLEVRYTAQDEFRGACERKAFASSLRNNIEYASIISEQLKLVNQSNGDEKAWIAFLELLVAHRKKAFREQEWRLENIERKHELRAADPAFTSRWMRKRRARESARISARKAREKKDNSNKLKLRKDDRYSSHLLRRYLKTLQLRKDIPLPHLLPYTPIDHQYTTNTPSASIIIPGSTKKSAITAAYDSEYIESIVIPGLEYDINQHHYLEDLRKIVEERGPFEVKINYTGAGLMPMPYIRMPYRRQTAMKEIAMDIKKLMLALRINSIWKIADSKLPTLEVKLKDGSYAVKGCNGFGEEERMFPRDYYFNLAIWEDFYENSLAEQIRKLTKNDPEHENEQRPEDKVLWTAFIEDTNIALREEVNSFFQKYRYLQSKASPLLRIQQVLQKKQLKHYDSQVQNFAAIVELLNRDRVFKHLELVNSREVKTTYKDYSGHDGVPHNERVGMGMQLADYLQEKGYRFFKWGMKFDKRFKF